MVTTENVLFNQDKNKISIQNPFPHDSDYGTESSLVFKSTMPTKKILSDYYAGYAKSLDAKDSPTGPYLITKVESSASSITFDNGKDSIFSKK